MHQQGYSDLIQPLVRKYLSFFVSFINVYIIFGAQLHLASVKPQSKHKYTIEGQTNKTNPLAMCTAADLDHRIIDHLEPPTI
jgi:hypothetical protein